MNPKNAPIKRIIGIGPGMEKARELIARFSGMENNVLIKGECGTGKSLVAEVLHQCGPYRKTPLIRLDCARLGLSEPERIPEMVAANQGRVLLLESVTDLCLAGQAGLLEATDPATNPVGVIATTDKNLGQQVLQGAFRQDLSYRLQGYGIALPPLRERPEDIKALARHFAETFARNRGQDDKQLTPALLDILGGYFWPGNVRQLKNIVEYACAVSRKSRVGTESLPEGFPAEPEPIGNSYIRITEKEAIQAALRRSGGHKTRAASELGIARSTLYRRMRELGIEAGL